MDNLLKARVEELCKKKGITINKLEKEIPLLKQGTVKGWDQHMPSIDRVAAVADYFGVSVDYLLGRSSETIVYKPKGFGALNKDGQKQVEDMIEFLLMKQAEKKSNKVGV